ncbi:MAG: TolC family protein [Lysobacterales bacterium]
MSPIRAALAAAVWCACVSAPAAELSLDDAYGRVIDTHPELEALRLSEAARRAELDLAQQAPPRRLQASAENLLGTGDMAALRGAEFSVSLASVIERGDKRAARVALADAELQGVELLRAGKRLDLLAEVARRYLDAAATSALCALHREDLAQREHVAAVAAQRRSAGIEQAAAPLAASAARAHAAAELERCLESAAHARRRLALLWGDVDADYALAPADLHALPALPDYAELMRWLEDTPELQRYAHEARLREARLQLARSARVADIDWQVGVRRLQSGDDWGLIGSVAIPFGSEIRAEPGIRAADAELAAVAFEREGQTRALQATVAEAWSQLALAVRYARRLDTEVIPAWQRAADAAEQSYRAGAISLLEWTQLQREIVDARQTRLEAALSAQRALIELQRLTGQRYALATTTTHGSTP